VTALPYREGVVKLPEGMTSGEGVMLDGEHLVVTSKAAPVSFSKEKKRRKRGRREKRDERADADGCFCFGFGKGGHTWMFHVLAM